MSAYEARIDAAVCNAIDHDEMVNEFIAITETQLLGDNDALADGMSDALYDRRTRLRILTLVRAGDLTEAAKIMHGHATTTYVNEQAETAATKEFRL